MVLYVSISWTILQLIFNVWDGMVWGWVCMGMDTVRYNNNPSFETRASLTVENRGMMAFRNNLAWLQLFWTNILLCTLTCKVSRYCLSSSHGSTEGPLSFIQIHNLHNCFNEFKRSLTCGPKFEFSTKWFRNSLESKPFHLSCDNGDYMN